MGNAGETANIEEGVRRQHDDVKGLLEIQAAHLTEQPSRVLTSRIFQVGAIIGVEAGGHSTTEHSQGRPAEALIREPADIQPRMRFQGAKILVGVVVQGQNLETFHQGTRRTGRRNPKSDPRSSALIANRATPRT